MNIRELDLQARKHGCRVVTQELLEDFARRSSRDAKRHQLLIDAHMALFGIIEDYPGIRYTRLRRRLQKIRSGIIAGLQP